MAAVAAVLVAFALNLFGVFHVGGGGGGLASKVDQSHGLRAARARACSRWCWPPPARRPCWAARWASRSRRGPPRWWRCSSPWGWGWRCPSACWCWCRASRSSCRGRARGWSAPSSCLLRAAGHHGVAAVGDGRAWPAWTGWRGSRPSSRRWGSRRGCTGSRRARAGGAGCPGCSRAGWCWRWARWRCASARRRRGAPSGRGGGAGGLAHAAADEEAVAAALEARPVFIDFTADWCLTCKFNEHRAAARRRAGGLRRRKVALFVADWTRRDAEIEEARGARGARACPCTWC